MSFAFLPLYTGDYRRDTQHLTPLRHGIYLLLLFHCWDTRGPLPLDEQEMAGIANCRSADEIDALRYVVRRFFVAMDDGHYNKRMQREIERANAISVKREDAGRRGANERMRRFREAQANAEQVLGNCLASDATPTTTTTTTTTKESTTLSGYAPDVGHPEAKAKGKVNGAAKESALRILETLNLQAGRRYHPVVANLEPIIARLREGYTESELRAIAVVKARQWTADEKMAQYLRPATLYNRTKCAQYRAELPANRMENHDA